MTKQNIILFGGSFDPIHNAHLNIALQCAQKYKADKVIFIPAKQSPLKRYAPLANDQHRFNMIELAIKNHSSFSVCASEFSRKTPSYSIHTVEFFKKQYVDANLFWLAGADVLNELVKWHRVRELLNECQMILTARPSFDFSGLRKISEVLGENVANSLKANILHIEEMDVSSTQIRDGISKGLDVSKILCEDVCQYILDNELYR